MKKKDAHKLAEEIKAYESKRESILEDLIEYENLVLITSILKDLAKK